MKHSVKHLRFPEAAVETVAEFRQITAQMLGADAVMDTPDVAFDIGDQGMNPGQDLHRLFSRPGHQPLMTETGSSIQEAVALSTNGLDNGLAGKALPRQALNFFAAESFHHFDKFIAKAFFIVMYINVKNKIKVINSDKTNA